MHFELFFLCEEVSLVSILFVCHYVRCAYTVHRVPLNLEARQWRPDPRSIERYSNLGWVFVACREWKDSCRRLAASDYGIRLIRSCVSCVNQIRNVAVVDAKDPDAHWFLTTNILRGQCEMRSVIISILTVWIRWNVRVSASECIAVAMQKFHLQLLYLLHFVHHFIFIDSNFNGVLKTWAKQITCSSSLFSFLCSNF